MGKEWGRGRRVSGRLKDKECPVVTPLGIQAAISLKQQACHVRPAAVMGAMAAANAVRGGGRA
eukprot:scaffold3132_cov119-Isochrysis_galbana.AAC.5